MRPGVRGRRDRPPCGGRRGRHAGPRGRARVPGCAVVGGLACAASAPGGPRPRRPGPAASAARRGRARRVPRRSLARVCLAHARRAHQAGWGRRGPRRPGLRRRGERARCGVPLPRRAVQPRPAPLVLRHRACPRDGGVRGAVSRRSAPAKERRVGRRRGVLPDAPERGELLALLVVGESRPRWRRRAPLLRSVPTPRDRRVTRGLAAAAALTLAVVTALIVQAGGDPASALRHVYLLPVVVLALAFGGLGGALSAGA